MSSEDRFSRSFRARPKIRRATQARKQKAPILWVVYPTAVWPNRLRRSLVPPTLLLGFRARLRPVNYKPIENYGLIGDLNTTALVATDGSIDFMCFPRFDSPTVFAALLDYKKGGHFSLAPEMEKTKHKQLYLPDSNVLLTRFLGETGMAEVSDFMPIAPLGQGQSLVRRAKCIRGELQFRMVCDPRFDYGRAQHRVEKKAHEVLFISQGSDKTVLRLRSTVPVEVENGAAVACFKLRSGEKASFVLEDGRRQESPCAAPDYVTESFKETMNFWQNWVLRSRYHGRWRGMVDRSALTLKLLTSSQVRLDRSGRHLWTAGEGGRGA